MSADCYEFYLWSVGAIKLPAKRAFELIDENQEEDGES